MGVNVKKLQELELGDRVEIIFDGNVLHRERKGEVLSKLGYFYSLDSEYLTLVGTRVIRTKDIEHQKENRDSYCADLMSYYLKEVVSVERV